MNKMKSIAADLLKTKDGKRVLYYKPIKPVRGDGVCGTVVGYRKKGRDYWYSVLLALCLLPFVTGCQTALRSDKIISETSWLVGIRLKTTEPVSGSVLPDVQLGVMRQTITMIPTSTNGTVYAPRFGSAYAGSQNAYDPIATDAQESVFSGDVMVGTNATGSAVIPKLAPK